MPFMKKRSLTTGICTAGIFMFSQEKSENGSLGRKSNEKGASRKDRAPKKKKVSQSQHRKTDFKK